MNWDQPPPPYNIYIPKNKYNKLGHEDLSLQA